MGVFVKPLFTPLDSSGFLEIMTKVSKRGHMAGRTNERDGVRATLCEYADALLAPEK